MDGEGTYEDPYRIENAADLLHFAELVSDGMTFKGQYVEQTADIDLDGQNMQPIGDVENEHCFYGVYNGAGHVIRNLNLKQSNSENVGLFSCLGGQVYNLGLEGGTIRGKYAGVIAGGSVGKEARIVNCYTDVAVTATRAGGIANDFDGRIFNCVSVGMLTQLKIRPSAAAKMPGKKKSTSYRAAERAPLRRRPSRGRTLPTVMRRPSTVTIWSDSFPTMPKRKTKKIEMKMK